MLERIRKLVIDYVDIDPEIITPELNIKNDLGMTSLALMNMIVELEDEFGIEIDEEAAVEFETLSDIMKYLKDNGVK